MDENRLPTTVALVGPGRAGMALALAIRQLGVQVAGVAGRSIDADSTRQAAMLLDAPAVEVAAVGRRAELVIVATPDSAIGTTAVRLAASVEPGALVIHLSGAHGLAVFDAMTLTRPDVLVGALHPLQALPNAHDGASRLGGSWCAVTGPPLVTRLAIALEMAPFVITDDVRAAYHATACIASNHLVALLAQVERLAAATGVPSEAFLPLVRATVDHVERLGAAGALTGPVARGDVATVVSHLEALPDEERPAYRALAERSLALVPGDNPAMLAALREATMTRGAVT